METKTMNSVYITLSGSQLADALAPTGWSYAARRAFATYLKELAEECDGIELNPVAISCDYAEYGSALEAAREMSDFQPDKNEDEDEQEESAMLFLVERTLVVGFDEGVIVGSF